MTFVYHDIRMSACALFEECCEIALDARGKVIGTTPRARCGC